MLFCTVSRRVLRYWCTCTGGVHRAWFRVRKLLRSFVALCGTCENRSERLTGVSDSDRHHPQRAHAGIRLQQQYLRVPDREHRAAVAQVQADPHCEGWRVRLRRDHRSETVPWDAYTRRDREDKRSAIAAESVRNKTPEPSRLPTRHPQLAKQQLPLLVAQVKAYATISKRSSTSKSNEFLRGGADDETSGWDGQRDQDAWGAQPGVLARHRWLRKVTEGDWVSSHNDRQILLLLGQTNRCLLYRSSDLGFQITSKPCLPAAKPQRDAADARLWIGQVLFGAEGVVCVLGRDRHFDCVKCAVVFEETCCDIEVCA